MRYKIPVSSLSYGSSRLYKVLSNPNSSPKERERTLSSQPHTIWTHVVETNVSTLVTNRKPYQGIVTRQVLRLRSLLESRILVNTWPTKWIRKHGRRCPHESSLVITSLNPKAQFILENQTCQDICTPSPDASYLDHKLRDGCHRGCFDYVTCPQVDTFNHQKATIFHNNRESHKS